MLPLTELTPELCEDLEEKVHITGDTVCHHRRKRLHKCVHRENSPQKLQNKGLLVRQLTNNEQNKYKIP